MGVIYKITSPSGKIYIGKTHNKRMRFAAYRFDLKKKKYNTILFRSLYKYGWDAHKIEIIEELPNEKLIEREIFWISKLKTYTHEYKNGMNMTKGGEVGPGPWMYDVERRKKQSKRLSGAGGSFYGKKHTEESRKIISEKTSIRNKKMGITIPKWGAEKGRLKVIKPIICYGLDGIFIREYGSIIEAATDLGIERSCISTVCSGRNTNAGGYIFKYKKTEFIPVKIETGIIKMQSVKRPVICFIGSYMIEYPSSLEASLDLIIPKTTINRAAQYNKGHPIRKGYVFIYSDQYKQKIVS